MNGFNKNAKIEVKVTDRFGNVYTEAVENKYESYVENQIFYIIDMLLVSPENRSESNPYFHLGG